MLAAVARAARATWIAAVSCNRRLFIPTRCLLRLHNLASQRCLFLRIAADDRMIPCRRPSERKTDPSKTLIRSAPDVPAGDPSPVGTKPYQEASAIRDRRALRLAYQWVR